MRRDCKAEGRRQKAEGGRRGVLLLVVLSLLVLFALIGVTFVIVAGQHYRTMKMAVRNEQYGDDPRSLCDAVAAQCIRDTNDTHSVVRGHSLLADMYGNDGIKISGTIGIAQTLDDSAMPGTVPEFIDLTCTDPAVYFSSLFSGAVTSVPPMPTLAFPLSLTQIQTPGFFNGCVLTMLNGPAANHSTRIVGWYYSGGTYTIRAMAFEDVPFATLTSSTTTGLLINGRPFNGTGFGYDSAAPVAGGTLLTATQRITLPSGSTVDIPYALLPNPVFSAFEKREPDENNPSLPLPPVLPLPFSIDPTTTTSNSYVQFGGIGGADEDYDAPDAQNMLLAYIPVNPRNSTTIGEILPSLHRPDTIAYLTGSNGPVTKLPNPDNPVTGLVTKFVLREMSLRPNTIAVPQTKFDHPSFPKMNVGGPYDVDNDRDGIAESIWVDVGFPVRTMPDGRSVKAMAAILCIDLDGRLNVNANGNIAHVDQYYFGTPSAAQTAYESAIPAACFAGSLSTFGRGQGYGPAEISLYPLFAPYTPVAPGPLPPTTPSAAYAALLAARYSEPNTSLTTTTYNSSAGSITSPYPGITAWNEYLSDLSYNDYRNPKVAAGRPSGFASPHDLAGRGFPVLDARGTPMTPYMDSATTSELIDDPYELNLSRRAVRAASTPAAASAAASTVPDGTTPNPHDSPFTVAELESVLRIYDVDASELPSRLRVLLNGTGGPTLHTLRSMVTTDSFDLPNASVLPTRDLRAAASTAGQPSIAQGVSDLLRTRLINGMSLMLPADQAILNAQMQKMLPWELASGQRMDINRPFGNSRDDNNNGIVDEPIEPATTSYWDPSRVPYGSFQNVQCKPNNGVDVDGDGNITVTDQQLSRHLYARHLYVLLMLLNDQDIDFDQDGNKSPQETARGLAQWAVNVVDFRDRDSIMTPFEFDLYPFNADGWNVDGNPTTSSGEPDRFVVWGCERPELLITETLAWHDRRTEDLNVEAGVNKSDPNDTETLPGTTQETMANKKDSDFDQRLRPFAPFFIELYNPWTTQASTTDGVNGRPSAEESSGEFQILDTAMNHASGVYLQKTSSVGNSPIWRMIVVKGASMLADPDDPNPPPGVPTFKKSDVSRAVYFADPTGITDLPAAVSFFPDPNEQLAPVLPGRYAVVGSAGLPGRSDPTNHLYVSPIGRVTGDTTGNLIANTRRIELTPNSNPNTDQVAVINNYAPGAYSEPALMDRQPIVAVALSKAVVGAATQSFPQVMASISEPLPGTVAAYPAVVYTSNPEGEYKFVRDIPVDKTNPELLGLIAGPSQQPADGTHLNFRVIHLQRLADPTQVWHVTRNPYLTVDSMSIDLTLFNGVTTANDPRVGGAVSGLASYQRGDSPPAATAASIWAHQALNTKVPAKLAPAPGGSAHNLQVAGQQVALQHSLGYLNKGYGIVATAGTAYTSANAPLPSYKGAPKTPFPWLTWNNRPFIGPMEMLLVPKSRSSRLLVDYAGLPGNLYQYPATATTPPGHLLNFFQVAGGSTPRSPSPAIFEYLQVPSRFAGTATMLNPPDLANGLANERNLFSLLRPPFNQVSNYRNPGRVNINTIPSDNAGNVTSAIWNGIVNATPGMTTPPDWQDVFASRLGAPNWNRDNSSSIFANPFRSAAGAALLLPGTPGTLGGTPNTQIRDDVDVTLMRPLDPLTNTASDTPLFDYQSTSSADNTTANPYFRLQNLQRLSNLLTTRSNVYAIWVTVGFFEVHPAPIVTKGVLVGGPNYVYPDGFQLGQEVGADTGEIKRHRAFYIYDRSIPVGFEAGVDHNYQDGLLLKRFIE